MLSCTDFLSFLFSISLKSFLRSGFHRIARHTHIRNLKKLNMLRLLRLTAVVLTVIISTAFTLRSKTSVSGEGIASGNIPFAINAMVTKGSSQIRYGEVTASVQSVAISSHGKMATIYFVYKESVLGVTVIDGKKRAPDQISDPFPVDGQQTDVVVPRLSYNTVTSGEIELR